MEDIRFNVILVDFSWVYNRYYFVATQKVEQEKVDYELYKMLHDFFSIVSENYWEANILMAMDSSTKGTKGYALNKNYKQNRDKEAKKEVYSPLRRVVLKLVETLPSNCSFLKASGREADEIIAHQVKRYHANYKILIFSGDKDLLQLTDFPNTYVSDKFSEGHFVVKTDKEIFEKFKNSRGEDFTRISENKRDILKYRVLRGDPSDNLPPVFPRIKDKEIVKIIQEYWLEDDFSENKMNQMITEIEKEDTVLASKLEAGRSTWMTNYEIMNLYDVGALQLRRFGK